MSVQFPPTQGAEVRVIRSTNSVRQGKNRDCERREEVQSATENTVNAHIKNACRLFLNEFDFSQSFFVLSINLCWKEDLVRCIKKHTKTFFF